MNFDEELRSRVAAIEEIISEYLPAEEGLQKTVIEAMNYSVLAGGKRLRPMLIWESYKLFGGEGEEVKPFMAAMEMLHTYSLVHDDLPAMDNDEYRRGRKTTHVQYGEAMGILAGDGLLNYAFETAFKAFDINPDNKGIPGALKLLAGKAGIYGMLGGQVVDVESEGQPLSREKLDFIYKLKTGALIESCVMIGAVLAGASDDEISLMERVAADVGLAFQIQDDILDVTSTLEVLGKPIGSDDKNNKTTYVTFEGLDKARADVDMISHRALDTLKSLDKSNPFLEQLIIRLIAREK